MDILWWFLFVYACVMNMSACSSSSIRSTVHINEETKEGVIVADVAHLTSAKSSSDARSRMHKKFRIINQRLKSSSSLDMPRKRTESKSTRWLKIDERTGLVKIIRRVDRDVVCAGKEECVIRAEIVLLPQEIFTLVELDVVIDDVNDNSPEFPMTFVTFNLSESRSVSEMINLDPYMASDLDSGKNSLIRYSLSNNSYFALKQFGDENGQSHVQLYLLRHLDHEAVTEVSMTVTAADSGVPPLTDVMTITIAIADANDNYPIFEQEEYIVTLKENFAPGNVIATVRANDMDSGAYGDVKYSIPARSGNIARGLVSIDRDRGTITLLKSVDRESHHGIRILVEAHDSDPNNPKSAETSLVIYVEDVNDNSPEINVDFVLESSENTVFISESSPIGSYLARVSASDADAGRNGDVTLRIATKELNQGKRLKSSLRKLPRDLFVLNDYGFVESRIKLDREVCNQYRMILTACDHGETPRCSTKLVLISVLDVNEFAPKFETLSQRINLREDTAVSTDVTTVAATDGDSVNGQALTKDENDDVVPSKNGQVFYSIVSGSGGVFTIDERSGLIRLAQPLDRETKSAWKLVVSARDGGNHPKESKSDITVLVDDVNDNPPRFTNPGFNNSVVYANIKSNKLVTKIKAVDYDSGFNAKIRYYLDSDNGVRTGERRSLKHHAVVMKSNNQTVGSFFILNPVTGDLRVNFSHGNLSEAIGIHRLVVRAQDSGTPPLSTRTTLRVIVTKGMIPRIEGRNEFSGSTDFLILAIALGCATIFLMFLIIAVALKCRKMNKEIRTYSVPKKSDPENNEKSDDDDSEKENSRDADISLENRQSFSEKASSRSSPASSPTKSEDKCQMVPALYQCDPTIKRLDIASSSHSDGDSGRGDSETEVVSCNVADAKEIYQRRELGNNTLGPHCDEKCRIYGHSDTCWMPVQSLCETQPRKALPHYDWNKMKPRYHYPERSRHSLAVADNKMHRARCSDSNLLPYNTSYVSVTASHPTMRHVNSVRLMPEFQRVPLLLQRPRSTTPTANYSGNNAHSYRDSDSFQSAVTRSCQSTPCEFKTCLSPGNASGYSTNFMGCGTGLGTLYESDYAGSRRQQQNNSPCTKLSPSKTVEFPGRDSAANNNIKTLQTSSHESRNIDSDLTSPEEPSDIFHNSVPVSEGHISMQETRQIIDDIESLLV